MEKGWKSSMECLSGPPPGEVTLLTFAISLSLFENRALLYILLLPLNLTPPASLANVQFVLEFLAVFINYK